MATNAMIFESVMCPDSRGVALSIDWARPLPSGSDAMTRLVSRKMNREVSYGSRELDADGAGGCLLAEVVAGIFSVSRVLIARHEAIIWGQSSPAATVGFDAERFAEAGAELVARKTEAKMIFGSFWSVRAAGDKKQGGDEGE